MSRWPPAGFVPTTCFAQLNLSKSQLAAQKQMADKRYQVLQNRIASAMHGGRVSWTSDGAEAVLFEKIEQVDELLEGMEGQNKEQRKALADVSQLMQKFDMVARSMVDPERTDVGVRRWGR